MAYETITSHMKITITLISCLLSLGVFSQVLSAKDLISLGQNDEKYFITLAKEHGYKFHKQTSEEIDYYYGHSVQNIVYGLARYSDNKILYMTLKLQDFQALQDQLRSLGFTYQEMNVDNITGKLFIKDKLNLFLYSSYEVDKGKKRKVYLINVFQ